MLFIVFGGRFCKLSTISDASLVLSLLFFSIPAFLVDDLIDSAIFEAFRLKLDFGLGSLEGVVNVWHIILSALSGSIVLVFLLQLGKIKTLNELFNSIN